jgi:ribonuclease J
MEAIKPSRIYEEDLAANPGQYVLSFSQQSGPLLDRAGALTGASAIWSLWSGYLKEPSGERLKSFLRARGIPLSIQHTSGHASVDDLRRLAKAVDADRVVPIHSFGSARFADLFDNVVPAADGEWWDV